MSAMRFLRQVSSVAGRSTASAAVTVPVGGLASVEATRASLPPPVASLLKDYPSVITLPVQWGEQDSYGHLNNVHYMRYFESGRMAYFEQVLSKFLTEDEARGFINAAAEKKIGAIVKSIALNYRKVVDYPDTVTVGTRVDGASVRADRFDQECVIVSHRHEAVVADGRCCVVTYDYARGTKAQMPARLAVALAAHRN